MNPDVRDCDALHLAIKNGHTEIVRMILDLLLDRGINPAIYINGAFRIASYSGQTEIVRLLLELPPDRGPAADEYNKALSCACYEGFTQIVRMLLELDRGAVGKRGGSWCKKQ